MTFIGLFKPAYNVILMPATNFKCLFLLVLTPLINACSTTGLVALNSTIKLENKHEITKNVAYGAQQWQRLDVYPSDSPDPAPVILFIYGGGWDSGKRSQYLFAANAFVRLGYTAVVPDYIKYPDGQFPSFIKDNAIAFKWAKQNIKKFNGDPNNTFIVGHSAGAHIGGLLASDPSYLAEVGFKKADIRGFAGLAGPYGFTPKARKYVAVFGPESNYPKMKAVNFVDGSEPPMLLMHGMKDKVVDVENKDVLLKTLNQFNVKNKDIEYNGVTHIGILLKLHPWFDTKHQVANDIDDFFKPLIK